MKLDIRQLEEDYLDTDDTIWTETDKVDKYKRAIRYGLDETEKRLILLYAYLGSQRGLAKLLRVSPATINRLLKVIREKIITNAKDYNYINTLADFDISSTNDTDAEEENTRPLQDTNGRGGESDNKRDSYHQPYKRTN